VVSKWDVGIAQQKHYNTVICWMSEISEWKLNSMVWTGLFREISDNLYFDFLINRIILD